MDYFLTLNLSGHYILYLYENDGHMVHKKNMVIFLLTRFRYFQDILLYILKNNDEFIFT